METLFKLTKDDSKKDSYMNQAQNIWSMLDEMASNNPESYKKFIEKTLKEGKEALKPPEAHMCVRASLIEPKSCNLFINIFSWNKIPAPETDEHPIPVFGKEIEYLNNVASINIAFNTEVLSKYGKNSDNKSDTEMLVNLSFQYIENQNNVKINTTQYKILDADCYGSVKECVYKLSSKDIDKKVSDLDLAKEALSSIEKGNKNLPDSILNQISHLGINENKPQSIEKKNLIQELESDKLELPVYEEKVVFQEDKNILELKINLPKITSINDCDLELDKTFLSLKSKFYKNLKILFKKEQVLDINKSEAKFIKKKFLLKIKIPFVN